MLRSQKLNIQFHDDWKTSDYLGIGMSRGDEINEWLTRHPEIDDYVCIDDGTDFYDNQKLILTNIDDGLSFENMKQIEMIISKWSPS